MADRCEIQLSYAIGVADPTSIMVETFGTEKVSHDIIIEAVRQFFDLRPYGLQEMLNLLQPSTRRLRVWSLRSRRVPFGKQPTKQHYCVSLLASNNQPLSNKKPLLQCRGFFIMRKN